MDKTLAQLPSIRKCIGKRKHLSIYKKIYSLSENFLDLNKFVGNIFPLFLSEYKVKILFEVRLGIKIPDCIFVFKKTVNDDVFCFFLEFKTTLSKASKKSIKVNKIHKAQYLQGLKQLQQSTQYLNQFKVAGGTTWHIFPVILFYKQKNLRLSFFKCFIEKQFNLHNNFVQFLVDYQDGKIRSLFSKSHNTCF